MTTFAKEAEKAAETFSRVAAIQTDMAYLAARLQEMAHASQQDMYRIMEGLADWALERKDTWSDANYARSLDELLNRNDPAGEEDPSGDEDQADHPADGIPAA